MADVFPVAPDSTYNSVPGALFSEEIDAKLFREWYPKNMFAAFSGNGQDFSVRVRLAPDGSGGVQTVGRISDVDHRKPYVNGEDVAGKGLPRKTSSDTIVIGQRDYPIIHNQEAMMAIGSPIDIHDKNETLQSLFRTEQRGHELLIAQAATTENYKDTTANGNMPYTERAVVSGQNYAYASNASLNTKVANAAAMKLADINLAILKAKRSVTEDAIRPSAYMNREMGFFYEFNIFLGLQQVFDLKKDPEFKSAFTERGTIVNSNQPNIVNGSTFIGKVLGANIMECNFLDDIKVNGKSWGFLMGAGAVELRWNKKPFHFQVPKPESNYTQFISRQVVGAKGLVFDAKTPIQGATHSKVEQGIVHIFSA